MSYLQITDFKFGMDRRRERVAGVPGTLWLGKNVHITRGGDIERRLKFVPIYNVAGSFGAAVIHSQLYTFGSSALTMPIGVQYQRLQAPSGSPMTKLLDVKTFSGKFYAIAEYADGTVHHFYNGARVTDWDNVVAAGADFTTLADLLASKIENDPAVSASAFGNSITITALVPGTPFTIAASAANGGGTNDQTATVTHTQANVAPVEEVRASAAFTINGGTLAPGVNQVLSVTIDGVEVLGHAIDWSGSNESTAVRVAQQISAGFPTHGYSASVVGATITVQAAPGTGATPNGFDFIVTPAGNVSLTSAASMAGGVSAVAAVTQIETVTFGGTFEAADTFTVTINGTQYKATGGASGMGRTLYVDKNRVWSPVGSLWRYCMINNPLVWDPSNATANNDAGFINIATATEGNERLLVAARYQGLAAVFSEENITLYQLDQDPDNFAFSDTLEHTGTKAAKSVIRYGNNDVFYLDITGVRSLRARDASNAPFVSDIGNAIDTYVQALVAALSKQEVSDALAGIEPKDGRYWLMLGDTIVVLSFFPGAKISAWTIYEPTEFAGAPVQAFVRSQGQMVARAGDFLYFYGGLTGDVLPDDDEVVAEVDLPFVSGQTPATIKSLTGFDVALTNTWACEIAFDPNDDQRTINVGNLSKITLADQSRIPLPGETSMVAPKLVCSKGGKATISMMAIHYESEDAPG
ncbi:hypothetical protein [Bradyrhizobium neotropicale]|uniref:hypothetical protein n=1 Tax=Bradyrhizobium neotropicale TaxID=1497615 RepID=UPI001AD77C5F|nr:hypothetical protein [Bradyrhizobium neotropicale]MBO4228013.1 hypothetical protein [Bradyrhizobium neotropicale]